MSSKIYKTRLYLEDCESPSVKDYDVLPDMAFRKVLKSVDLHRKNEKVIQIKKRKT